MRLRCVAVALAAPILSLTTLDLSPQQPTRAWLAELLAGRSDRSAAREMLARVWRNVETAGIRADIPDSLLRTLGFRSQVVRGRLRVTVPADREFVAVEDLLPAGLEVVDLSLRTSSLGPFESEESRAAVQFGNRANTTVTSLPWLYGRWVNGWWSPWEHHEIRDDRVVYFARVLWKGSYTASYVARATTAGTFVRPPAHAEEMYNPSLGGRSEGGSFRVIPRQ